MVPLHGINVAVLEENFRSVIAMLHRCGLQVVATVADNHPVNRAFFLKLTGNGDINKPCRNPCDPSKPLFLLIDPLHTLKNVYNNFQKSGKFKFHQNSFFASANIDHIRQMYDMESAQSLRMAHKLVKMVFNPTNIQRTSAKLTMALFHDSTVAALAYPAAEKYPEWRNTHAFLAYINNFIRIINVKTSTVGKRRMDDLKTSFTSADDPRLDTLKKYAEFFRLWKEPKQPGLTSLCILFLY
jgi:hypothetical protein